MAPITLTDCKIFLGGYNLSGYHNQLTVEHTAEMLDDTVFGTSGTRSSKPGLKRVQANGNIFWDSDIDAVVFQRIGATREVMSWAAFGNSLGDISNSTRGVNGTYNPLSGEVGALIQSEFSAEASNTPLVRGQVLIPPAVALTASGNGGVVNMGAVGALQRIYSALHVYGMTGGSTIQVIIQSDDAAGFPSATTRLTHTLYTAPNFTVGDWQEAAGPITDTHWRASWTITGGGPSILAYLTFGIQ